MPSRFLSLEIAPDSYYTIQLNERLMRLTKAIKGPFYLHTRMLVALITVYVSTCTRRVQTLENVMDVSNDSRLTTVVMRNLNVETIWSTTTITETREPT